MSVLMLCLTAACNLVEPISYDALNAPDETLPIPSETRTCDNEPPGLVRALASDMGQLPALSPSFSSDGFTHFPNQANTLSIESSASAPLSPPSVLRILYPGGSRGGHSPSRWGTKAFPANTGTVYVCAWVRFMTGWTHNGNVGTKLFFITGGTGSNHFVGTWGADNSSRAYLYTGLQLTGGDRNLGLEELPHNDVAGGAWHKFEVLWEANTPGQPNGRYSQWVDGRLIAVAQDVVYVLPGASPAWKLVWFDPTFGGGSNPVPREQFIEFDHIIVSVK